MVSKFGVGAENIGAAADEVLYELGQGENASEFQRVVFRLALADVLQMDFERL